MIANELTTDRIRTLLADPYLMPVGFFLYRKLYMQPTPEDQEQASLLHNTLWELSDQIALTFGLALCRQCHWLIMPGQPHDWCEANLAWQSGFDAPREETPWPADEDWPDYKTPEQIALEEQEAWDAYYADRLEEEEAARNAQDDPETWEDEELSADDDLFAGTGQWARN